MELHEVMAYLESKGSEQTRKIYYNHGAKGELFGVKVGDMKPIQKKEKNNHELALQLFDTRNSDAQYLAGLIADPQKFTRKQFEHWVANSNWYMVAEYALAWNLAESPLCMELCKEWLDHDSPLFQVAAWASLSSYVSYVPNEDIDIEYHKLLLNRVEQEIHKAHNRVRYCMNGYVIALGGAIPELTDLCKEVGERIGKVEVFMGKTSCKVPAIVPYIDKIEAKGRIGKKRKTAKC